MQVFVGTSGFSYGDWKDNFYPPGLKPADRLSYFATKFTSVEINMTFYRPVAEKTLLIWKDAVPKNFTFTMKGSKIITHYKRLKRCEGELKFLWQQFSPLQEQLSCVLFQLPPSLSGDAELLSSFLDGVRSTQKKYGVDSRIAIEFRTRKWYGPETFSVLQKYDATAVLHDMPYKGGFWPIEEGGERILKSGHLLLHPEDWIADTGHHFFYLRFHGTVDARAWQEYGRERLQPWAAIARECMKKKKPLYAYFNNDATAAATRDAQIFRSLLAESD